MSGPYFCGFFVSVAWHAKPQPFSALVRSFPMCEVGSYPNVEAFGSDTEQEWNVRVTVDGWAEHESEVEACAEHILMSVGDGVRV